MVLLSELYYQSIEWSIIRSGWVWCLMFYVQCTIPYMMWYFPSRRTPRRKISFQHSNPLYHTPYYGLWYTGFECWKGIFRLGDLFDGKYHIGFFQFHVFVRTFTCWRSSERNAENRRVIYVPNRPDLEIKRVFRSSLETVANAFRSLWYYHGLPRSIWERESDSRVIVFFWYCFEWQRFCSLDLSPQRIFHLGMSPRAGWL